MRMRFVGGPWDGVEFDATYCPDQIGMRDLDIDSERCEDDMTEVFRMSKREHHQYLLEAPRLKEGVKLKVGENLEREPEEGEDPLDLVEEELIVMVYRYAPGQRVWWER